MYLTHGAPNGLERAQDDENIDDDVDLDEDFQLSPAPGVDEDPIKTRFERDVEDARRFSIDLQNSSLTSEEKKNRQLNFVMERRSAWDKTTEEGRNFLHHLAYYNYRHDMKQNPPISLQWLMGRAILRLPPYLTGSLDHEKHTPLTAALLRGNDMFGYSMCRSMSDAFRQKFRTPLLKECENGGGDSETTCLHAAASSIFDNGEKRLEVFKNICGFVPQEMFSVKDKQGRTPLHLAVEYERCCNSQVEVVRELLRSCPGLLDIPIQDPDNPGRFLSAYQYHHHTRKKRENKMTKSQRKGTLSMVNPDPISEAPMMIEHNQELKLDPKKDAKRVPTRTNMGLPASRDKGDAVSKQRGSMAITPKGAMSPIQTPTLAPIVRVKSDGLATITQPEVLNKYAQKAKETADAAKAISNMLKLECLRSQSPEKAAESLRLQDDLGKEFWFDFGPPKTLSEDEFRKHFGHLQFDTALHYVGFRQVRLKGNREQPDLRYQDRKDMVFFFDWLRKKPDTKIVKVVVDDMEPPSHSDEAIEQSLRYFNVEILDWRRLDLDPVSLRTIGTNLRELHLQWSGSNSALRAWSEKERLATIPTLEVIHLFQHEGLESSGRTLENLEAFERRLHESWPTDRPRPRVIRPKTGGGRRLARVQATDARPQPQERSIDPHKWIKCMENFSDRFKQIKALRETTNPPVPVEVALIDDGVDITHPDLNDIKDRKFFGTSFDSNGEGSNSRVPPFWSSSSGHGTLMARFIHKICPSAIIHVIKLQTVWVANSQKLQIKTDSTIKAIDYAAKRGSQIICMSWTIKPPEGELRKQFNAAIQNAVDNHGILIFCAASDQGQSADLTYPHASNRQCFRIGAAKATGTMLDTVGDPHDLDFIFPGHEVVIDSRGDESKVHEFDAHTGSSVANALATGLAALVIECVRLGVFYTRELKKMDPKIAIKYRYSSIDPEDLVKIRTRSQMVYALNWIGTNQNTNNKYIEVWHTFNVVAEKLAQSEGVGIEQLEHIATLAEHFLKKGLD